jgi:hypothetical protein
MHKKASDTEQKPTHGRRRIMKLEDDKNPSNMDGQPEPSKKSSDIINAIKPCRQPRKYFNAAHIILDEIDAERLSKKENKLTMELLTWIDIIINKAAHWMNPISQYVNSPIICIVALYAN